MASAISPSFVASDDHRALEFEDEKEQSPATDQADRNVDDEEDIEEIDVGFHDLDKDLGFQGGGQSDVLDDLTFSELAFTPNEGTSSEDSDDEIDYEANSSHLVESFLDLEEPTLNKNLMDFFKRDGVTETLLSFLSRLDGVSCSDLPKVDYDLPISVLAGRSAENDEKATRSAKLSYQLMRMLSPVADEGPEENVVKTYLQAKLLPLCSHALAVFHGPPVSKGNPYHACYVLDAAISEAPQQFFAMICKNALVQQLFKNFLLRAPHLGTGLDLLGNIFSLTFLSEDGDLQETADELREALDTKEEGDEDSSKDLTSHYERQRQAVEQRISFYKAKEEFFELVRDWKFFQYVACIVASPNQRETVVQSYSHFFMEMTRACSVVLQGEVLFKGGVEEEVITMLFEVALDPSREKRDRCRCCQLLMDFLEHLSLDKIPSGDQQPLMPLMPIVEPQPNRIHHLLPSALKIVQRHLPKLFIALSTNRDSPESEWPPGQGEPYGAIRISLLRLITSSFALNSQAPEPLPTDLSHLPKKFTGELLDKLLRHGGNNFLAAEFSKLFNLSMRGSTADKAFALRLLKELKFIEKLSKFYETKPNRALHGYILEWFSSLEQCDPDADAEEDSDDSSAEDSSDDAVRFDEEKDDEDTDANKEQLRAIREFINKSEAWKDFYPLLQKRLNIHRLKQPPVREASNPASLEYLLQALMNPTPNEGSEEPETLVHLPDGIL